MKVQLRCWGILVLLLALAPTASANLVRNVRAAAGAGDFAKGESLVQAYQSAHGKDPELALAVSWLGRAALAAKDYSRADRYAAQARRLSLELLEGRQLDDETKLPLALGASIEVEGQSLAAQGARSEAVAFLAAELERWRDTSIRARIQKNINLLSLEGEPAPPLELGEYLGPPPSTLADLKGKVVLLFMWAHWCGGCKGQAPILARLSAEFAGEGLVIVAPTRRYGYASRGMDVSPEVELRHIDDVRKEYYGRIPRMPVPVSEETFANYGVSTTPTLVLIDRRGIVRLYHPGEMSYEELALAIKALL